MISFHTAKTGMTESDPESDRFLIENIIMILSITSINITIFTVIIMMLTAMITLIIVHQHNHRLAIIKRSNKSKYDNDFAWEEAR